MKISKNLGADKKIGKIIFNQDGTFTADQFPLGYPLRLANREGAWTITDPSMTPSGKWSIELNGIFLVIKATSNGIILYYPIDVLDGYSIDYEKN